MKSIEEMIDEEPELPGDMPDEMFNTIKGDKDAITQALRIAVRQTKNNIKRKILSRFAEQKGIINSLCVRWGHSIRLIAIIEERFKQRCELSINCNNCYAGLLTKINKESLVENDLTDLSLYSEREKLICDQKKKITELEKQIESLKCCGNCKHYEHKNEM